MNSKDSGDEDDVKTEDAKKKMSFWKIALLNLTTEAVHNHPKSDLRQLSIAC